MKLHLKIILLILSSLSIPVHAAAEVCITSSAGVTTFKDAAATIPGRSVRSGIDDYKFIAQKRIKKGNQKILVGKLLDSDGSILEEMSYAWEDEWECKTITSPDKKGSN